MVRARGHWILALLIALLQVILPCHTARILSFSIFASKSHKNVYQPLLEELARRGHEVTSVNPVRSSTKMFNGTSGGYLREIVGIHVDEFTPKDFNVFDHLDIFKGSMYDRMGGFMGWIQGTQRCPEFYSLPQIQEVLREDFDLVLINPVSNECLLGAVHHYGVPSIFISTLTTVYWVGGHAVGDPTLPSHLPIFFSMAPPNEVWSFRDRVDSFVCHVLLSAWLDYLYYPWTEAMYRAQFGAATPGVHQILANTSLILSNSHYSLNFPRPLMPNHVDVGGMHCRPARPVAPQELDEFLTASGEKGFIYFSMGSMIQANAMPDRFRTLFLNTFAALNMSVLWKWENDTLGGVDPPANIKISRWAPQQDVLGHPNIKLFITHGGLLSTEEAVYHGVPLLGFPIWGDQHYNMKMAEDAGFALKLNFGALGEEILLETIIRILKEPKFKAQALALSATFRDRPQSALDLAVYWVEYVVRHGGAPHLRSPARLLSTWAYYSLDVVTFLTACFCVAAYICIVIVRICCKMLSKMVRMKQNKSSKTTGLKKNQ